MQFPGTEPLCNFCDEAVAVLHCFDCNMNLCTANGCDDQLHSGKRHKKEAIQGSAAVAAFEEEAPVCEFCAFSPSEYYCEDCCMYLCTANGCLASVHKNAVGHELTSLDGEGSEDFEGFEDQEGPSQTPSEVSSQNGDSKPVHVEPQKASPPPPAVVQKAAPKTEPAPPPIAATPKTTAASDLPRSLTTTPATSRSPSKSATPSTPAATTKPPVPVKPTSPVTPLGVIRKIIAPIRGTGTKEEREKRKEEILKARSAAPLPRNTFGSKFAPEDPRSRRKASLPFLKSPTASRSAAPSSAPISRTPSARTPKAEPRPAETKRGTGDIVITSVTTIRTTTTIRADPPSKAPPSKPPLPAAATRSRSGSNSSVASTSALPPSWSASDKNASPAAALPSSLFSPSSALPSPTASSARGSSSTPTTQQHGRRASQTLTSPPQPQLTTPSPNARQAPLPVHARRASDIRSPGPSSLSLTSSLSESEFDYPAGLAPLGLKYISAPEAGVLIRTVTPGEAGDKAGIQPGDVVKLMNRKAVRSLADFHSILSEFKPGVVYKLAVVRNDKSIDIKLVL